MNIEDLTIKQVQEIQAFFPRREEPITPWQVGENYLIRTVTMIDTGRLIAVTDQELVLEDAAWIADTGRFANSLTSCEFGEVEPFPDGQVIIGRTAVIDAVIIPSLPRTQK